MDRRATISHPANDNEDRLAVRLSLPAAPPISDVEIEIFSLLISSVEGLLAANDNVGPDDEASG